MAVYYDFFLSVPQKIGELYCRTESECVCPKGADDDQSYRERLSSCIFFLDTC